MSDEPTLQKSDEFSECSVDLDYLGLSTINQNNYLDLFEAIPKYEPFKEGSFGIYLTETKID